MCVDVFDHFSERDEVPVRVRKNSDPQDRTNRLVACAAPACRAGRKIIEEPFDIPVGRATIVADPFGNVLVLLDLSNGTYVVDADNNVIGVNSTQ